MKLFGICLDVITTLIIIFLAFFLSPMLFDVNPYVVLSGSMEPTIAVGSLAYIDTDVNADEINPGDIIAYKLDDIAVTHRVVNVEDNYFVTKGDANKTNDSSPVKKSRLIGKIAYSVPYMGYVIKYLKSPFTTVFIICLSICHVVNAVLSNIKQKENSNEFET